MENIYPQSFEEKLGVKNIWHQLETACLSSMGIKKISEIRFETSYESVLQQLQQTQEAHNIVEHEDAFPLQHYFDMEPVINRLKTPGSYATTEELNQLLLSQQTIKAIIVFLQSEKNNEKYPHLSGLSKDVEWYSFVPELLLGILDRHGQIRDKASARLFEIRSSIREKSGSLSRVAQQLLKKARQESWADADAELTLRNGRYVIPLNATYKRKMGGMVVDESSTGKTSFVEPAELYELNNKIQDLLDEEKREIRKILIQTADQLRPYTDGLESGYHFLGQIDFLRTKAIWARKNEAILCKIVDEPVQEIVSARHPLLDASLKKQGRKMVPLNLHLDQANRLLIISGPNAGGKSVCLQTAALLQYLLQCGMLVPVGENSVMGIFHQIFIDIGDEQSIENDLSTYSSHLLNMKHFVRMANERTFICIDEFGSGTEPALGGAIAEAILEDLNDKKVTGIITTHYSNLKHFAAETPGLVNGAMLYDNHNMQPLFRLEMGKPGSSFAFEIARKIGIPENILEQAKEKIGEEHVAFDKHLKDVLRDKKYWIEKRDQIRVKNKRLEQTLDKYSHELEEIEKFRKQVIREAKEEAKTIIKEANKKIEQAVREIKESQAEKEQTRKARQEIEHFKQELSAESETNGIILKKKKQLPKNFQPSTSTKPKITAVDIEIGDTVQIVGQEATGEVLDKNDGSYVVAIGQMITTLPFKRLMKVEGKQGEAKTSRSKSGNYAERLREKKLNFKPRLDVRGKRGDEALQQVAEFIDDAIMCSSKTLHILHGKGNGILRDIIRDYLSSIGEVKNYHDEAVEFGGAGITIVNLNI